jgi:hypothetical protein
MINSQVTASQQVTLSNLQRTNQWLRVTLKLQRIRRYKEKRPRPQPRLTIRLLGITFNLPKQQFAATANEASEKTTASAHSAAKESSRRRAETLGLLLTTN